MAWVGIGWHGMGWLLCYGTCDIALEFDTTACGWAAIPRFSPSFQSIYELLVPALVGVMGVCVARRVRLTVYNNTCRLACYDTKTAGIFSIANTQSYKTEAATVPVSASILDCPPLPLLPFPLPDGSQIRRWFDTQLLS